MSTTSTEWVPGTPHPTGGYDTISSSSFTAHTYRKNGKLHRLDGPAEESPRYADYWYEGERHREDGPAVNDLIDGSVEWWLHGDRHRLDGPAVAHADGGRIEWWVLGERISKAEFDEFRAAIDGGAPVEWVLAYLEGART